MLRVYTLRHMFQATLEGEHTPIFFTRDNEHLISQLPEDVLNDAIQKKWVESQDILTMTDLKQQVKEAKAAEKERIKKGGGK